MKPFLRNFAPVLLLLAQVSANAGMLDNHPGRWMGELTLPDGRVLKLGAEIFKRADGSAWASFASPDQGAYDIPMKSVSETGGTALLELGFGSMTLTWADDHFKGEWKQGGAAFPLDLKQVADFPRKVRRQTPVAPMPFERTLAIPSADGVMLGATLSMPASANRPNLVILVHGSGPQTRDEEVEGHRTFAVLADHLARQGIAVLRYDKRGISRSTGDYANHTQAQLADDVGAVVRAMRATREFRHVGVLGHSEGPMLAARYAAGHPGAIDFIVSLAGVGLPGIDLMLLQDRMEAADHGADAAAVERLMPYVRDYYRIVMTQDDPAARVAALKALYDGLSAEDRALVVKHRMNQGTLSTAMAAQPMLPALLKANPVPDWRAVRCPVLVLNGSLDRQVPVESMNGIVAALKAGGNRKVESAVMPSLNHMFQTAKTGKTDEYGALDETISPEVLSKVTSFIRKQ